MTIRLTIICHASTAAVRAGAFPQDEPLDAQGAAAAAQIAKIANFQPDYGWCGPEQRTRQTAAVVGLSVETVPALADWHCGGWAGRTLGDLFAEVPDAVAAWMQSPDAAPHGGESLNDLLGRAGNWLDGLLAMDPGAPSLRLVAVTHPAIVRAAIVKAIYGTGESFWRIDAGPLARCDLTGRGGRWTLKSINQAKDWKSTPEAETEPD